MKKIKKNLLFVALVLVTIIITFIIMIQLLAHRTYDVPESLFRASTGSVLIAKGGYQAFGPAHCMSCHIPGELISAAMNSTALDGFRNMSGGLTDTVPLSGGFSYSFELGTLHLPNITPDTETGIGRFTDGQLTRVIRNGIRPDGRAIFPLMEYQIINDEDLVALASFLCSQNPVFTAVPSHDLSFGGKAVQAFLFRPVYPDGDPTSNTSTEEDTIERREYLANWVVQSVHCHTQRNQINFTLEGPSLAGGSEFNETWAPELTLCNSYTGCRHSFDRDVYI